jgi:hypothetical protein
MVKKIVTVRDLIICLLDYSLNANVVVSISNKDKKITRIISIISQEKVYIDIKE